MHFFELAKDVLKNVRMSEFINELSIGRVPESRETEPDNKSRKKKNVLQTRVTDVSTTRDQKRFVCVSFHMRFVRSREADSTVSFHAPFVRVTTATSTVAIHELLLVQRHGSDAKKSAPLPLLCLLHHDTDGLWYR